MRDRKERKVETKRSDKGNVSEREKAEGRES